MAILVTADDLRTVLDVPEAVVPDADLEEVCSAVDGAVLPLLTPDHAAETHPNCREAGLGIAVQVWQARTAPGGAMVGVDLNLLQSPHLLGPGLVPRFMGLLSPCTPTGGAVVA